jgi:Uma2 family endonuclease
MSAIAFRKEVYYPESDGKPMAESELHLAEIIYLVEALKDHYRDVPDVHVGGILLLYYMEGNPRKSVAPDVFVTKGISKRLRKTYKLWEEGVAPCLVIEVTSDSTRDEDLDDKMDIYCSLGVEEYVLFDPLGDYLKPPLQGHELRQGRYVRLPLEPDGSLRSVTTGLAFRPEPQHLAVIDPKLGEVVPRDEELRAERVLYRQTQRALEAETAARRAVEEENARLRAELARRKQGS